MCQFGVQGHQHHSGRCITACHISHGANRGWQGGEKVNILVPLEIKGKIPRRS